MKRLEIVQIGIGHVGRAMAQIVLEERKRWRERDGIEVATGPSPTPRERWWGKKPSRRQSG